MNDGGSVDKINENGPLQFLLYAITITVVSIPEGLPLAVTLTLAYSVRACRHHTTPDAEGLAVYRA